MICEKCGKENPEESLFCNACGAKILNEEINDIKIDNEREEEVKLNENILHSDKNNKKLSKLISLIIGDDIEIDKKQENIQSEETVEKSTEEILVVPNESSKKERFSRLFTNIKTGLKTKNKKIIMSLVFILLIVVGGVGYAIIKPPSAESVFNIVKDYDTDKLNTYLNDVYPQDGGFLGLFKEENRKKRGDIITLKIKQLDQQFKNAYGMSMDDFKNIKITKVDISRKNYSSDYVDINVTVTNGGTTSINYIKINLYFKDKSGKIVKSEWTNDSSNIKPGASQVVTEMTKKDGWDSVSAEISDIR